MKKIILFGDTGFSAMVAAYIHEDTTDEVVAYTVDAEFLAGRTNFEDRPLIPFGQIREWYPLESYEVLVTLSAAVKKKHYNAVVIERVRAWGYRLYSFVHSSAFVAKSAILGDNVLIFPHAVVEPRATIHEGVFVRSGAYVSHDTSIGAYSYIAPRVAFSGYVETGPHCFFGTNATIRDRISIGRDVVVGTGAVVLKNLPDESVLKAAQGTLLDIDRFKLKL